MHASLVRRQLGGLIPPKIASPSILVSQHVVLRLRQQKLSDLPVLPEQRVWCKPCAPREFLLQAAKGACSRSVWRDQSEILQREECVGHPTIPDHVCDLRTELHDRLPE